MNYLIYASWVMVACALGLVLKDYVDRKDELRLLKQKEHTLLKKQKDDYRAIDSLSRYIKAQRYTACVLSDKKYKYYSHGIVSSMVQFDGFTNYVFRYYPEQQLYCYCDSITRDSL